MKPLGRKKQQGGDYKHKVSGADRRRGFIGWWENVIEPTKARDKREYTKEIEGELMEIEQEQWGAFVGRMAPIHIGHTYTIEHIIDDGLTPIVFVGSANKIDDKNPWKILDRMKMVNIVYPGMTVLSLEDKECWDEWFEQLIDSLQSNVCKDLSQITIYTHNKPDDRLDFTFRGIDYKNEHYSKMYEIAGLKTKDLPESDIDLHATDIRRDLDSNEHNLHPDVFSYLKGL